MTKKAKVARDKPNYYKKISANLIMFYLLICFTPSSLYASNMILVEEKDSLQQIIDKAVPGSTILLKSGEYDGPIKINHSLKIISQSDTNVTIINNTNEAAITLNAPNVSLMNLTVKDLQIKEQPTLLILADHTELNNISIVTGNNGIHINGANQGKINNTNVSWGAKDIDRSNKENGIEIFNAEQWQIDNTIIKNMQDGIYLERVNTISINNSHIEGSRYGLHFMFVSNGRIENNVGLGNVTGAMIMASSNINVIANSFLKQVENLNSQGILLYDTKQSSVISNTIEGNRVGLYIEQSSDVLFSDNMIKNNFIGLQWMNSSNNTFQANSVVGNVIDVQSIGVSKNEINKNYWDNSSGIDTNGDGFSETSYSINPLFYGLTKKQPPFQIFFNSPGMTFLESIYKADTSSWMTDREPKMKLESTDEVMSNRADRFDSLFISLVLLILSIVTIIKSRRKIT